VRSSQERGIVPFAHKVLQHSYNPLN
jgi:hypothetical protein